MSTAPFPRQDPEARRRVEVHADSGSRRVDVAGTQVGTYRVNCDGTGVSAQTLTSSTGVIAAVQHHNFASPKPRCKRMVRCFLQARRCSANFEADRGWRSLRDPQLHAKARVSI